jgi:hypothetical protein
MTVEAASKIFFFISLDYFRWFPFGSSPLSISASLLCAETGAGL